MRGRAIISAWWSAARAGSTRRRTSCASPINIDPNYTDAQYNLAVFYLENKPLPSRLARRHYFRAVELGAEPDPEIEATLKNSAEPEKIRDDPRGSSLVNLEVGELSLRRGAGDAEFQFDFVGHLVGVLAGLDVVVAALDFELGSE